MSTTSNAPLVLALPAPRHTGFPGVGFDNPEAVRVAVTAKEPTRDGLPCSIVRTVRGEDLEFTVELDLRDDGVILSHEALVLAHERTQDGRIAFEQGSRIELTPSEFSDAQKRRPYRKPARIRTGFEPYADAGHRISDFM